MLGMGLGSEGREGTAVLWEGLGHGGSFVGDVEAQVEHGDGAREWFGKGFGRLRWIRVRREGFGVEAYVGEVGVGRGAGGGSWWRVGLRLERGGDWS